MQTLTPSVSNQGVFPSDQVFQMVDLCDKGSEGEDMISQSSQQSQTTSHYRGSLEAPQIKTCVDCGTTKTPLWRGGPTGPKSLCNACGIRSRKKRRALLGLNKDDNKKTKKQGGSNKNVSHHNSINNTSTSNNKGYESTSSTADSTSKYGVDTLKRKLLSFGRDVVALQRPRSSTTQRRKLGEEEQAAFLLMALSCGSVYA